MDDLPEKLRALYVAYGTNYVQAAADTIESMRQQLAERQRELRLSNIGATMTPEFNRWWDADELTQTNPYTEDTPIWWAWEGWQAAQRAIVDCNTCANRGRIDGLSQETHCEHCKWQGHWHKKDLFAAPEPKP